jgi:hypothetical protein
MTININSTKFNLTTKIKKEFGIPELKNIFVGKSKNELTVYYYNGDVGVYFLQGATAYIDFKIVIGTDPFKMLLPLAGNDELIKLLNFNDYKEFCKLLINIPTILKHLEKLRAEATRQLLLIHFK